MIDLKDVIEFINVVHDVGTDDEVYGRLSTEFMDGADVIRVKYDSGDITLERQVSCSQISQSRVSPRDQASLIVSEMQQQVDEYREEYQ